MKAVIFDMDGVLVDSEPWWGKAEKEVLSLQGITPMDEEAEQYNRLFYSDFIEKIAQLHGAENFDCPKASSQLITKMTAVFQNHMALNPGVTTLVKELHRRNIPCAIASSSPRQLVQTIKNIFSIRIK